MDSEKSEIFHDTKRTVASMMKDKSLSEKAHELPGCNVELPLSLLGLMGDLPAAETNRINTFKALETKLEKDRKTEAEIDKELSERYKEDVSGNECLDFHYEKYLISLHINNRI